MKCPCCGGFSITRPGKYHLRCPKCDLIIGADGSWWQRNFSDCSSVLCILWAKDSHCEVYKRRGEGGVLLDPQKTPLLPASITSEQLEKYLVLL